MVLNTNLSKKQGSNGAYDHDQMMEGDEGVFMDGQGSNYEESSDAQFNGRGVLQNSRV
jgi:hypothetical protein